MSLSSTLLNYLKEAERKSASNQYIPHPIIKALLLAMEAARKGRSDGNYGGLSGDADLTPNKQPQLLFIVTLKKNGEQFEVLELREMNTMKVVTAEMTEKIVHSEILIEKFNTLALPNKEAEAIMTDSLGFRVHILEDKSEIEQALKNAQRELKSGRARDVSWQVKDEILIQKDTANWGELFSESRALIASLWAPKSGASVVITNLEPSVPKWKLRGWIFRFLDFKSMR